MSAKTYPIELTADDRGERWRIRGNQIMAGVHSNQDCTPPCVLHHPSDHNMRAFPLYWRTDRHLFERICPHGVGHPDPDDDRRDALDGDGHDCDGCCR